MNLKETLSKLYSTYSLEEAEAILDSVYELGYKLGHIQGLKDSNNADMLATHRRMPEAISIHPVDVIRSTITTVIS